MIILGSAAIALAALTGTGAMFGAYALALSALHNHQNLSVAQSCRHWGWVFAATARDGTPALHAAVSRILASDRCPR